MRPLGATAMTAGGVIQTLYDHGQAAEAARLPRAPYPPSEWDRADFLADSAQQRLLQEYGPVRYEAYLRRSTGELAAYHPDWKLVVGLVAGAIALVIWKRGR